LTIQSENHKPYKYKEIKSSSVVSNVHTKPLQEHKSVFIFFQKKRHETKNKVVMHRNNLISSSLFIPCSGLVCHILSF